MTGDAIRWFPVARVLKYSPDQTGWAQAATGRRRVTGDQLRALFPAGPEEGESVSEGNSLTVNGQLNIARLIAGEPAGIPLTAGHVLLGVGADPSANPPGVLSMATLSPRDGERPGGAWYQPMDSGYPAVLAPNMVSGQATLPAGVAEFAWEEWCWAVAPVVSGPGGPYLHQAAEDAVMLNRKAASHGAKSPGRSWVFQCTVRLV